MVGPLETGQRRWTRYRLSPSRSGLWVAVNDDDIITFGSLPRISSRASGGNRQTNEKWLVISPKTHPARASPWVTSVITSTAALAAELAAAQR